MWEFQTASIAQDATTHEPSMDYVPGSISARSDVSPDRVERLLREHGSDLDGGDTDLLAKSEPVRNLVNRILATVLGEPFAHQGSRLPSLTPREDEVMSLIAEGMTAQRTARHLGISTRTVNKHLEHIYDKLGCNERVSAVSVWQRQRWFTADAPVQPASADRDAAMSTTQPPSAGDFNPARTVSVS